MKGPAHLQGEIIWKLRKIHRRNLKIVFSRHLQGVIIRKLRKKTSAKFKNRLLQTFTRENKKEIAKNTSTKFKNRLLQNYWINFNQTLHKALLDDCLFGGLRPTRFFYTYGDVTIAGEGLQILTCAQHSLPLSSEGFF